MITLNVNGVRREVQAADETPLLYVLRNDLQLIGPQFGCGLAQCGACAVLIDGKETRSCVTPVASVAEPRDHHARRFARALGQAERTSGGGCEEHASPGAAGVDRRADSAVRLLPERHDDQGHGTSRKQSESDSDEIKAAFTTSGMSPHLCRCGTYVAIIDAVQHAAEIMAKRS